jgi:lipopolysaccharide transport system permease protein
LWRDRVDASSTDNVSGYDMNEAAPISDQPVAASIPSKLPTTVYTPVSPLRRPWQLVREMIGDTAAARELAWRLFLRDIRAQYRNSILGYVWIFLPPLAASLPFIFLNSAGVVRMEGTPIPYAAYAMVGTLIWQVFVDALNTPLKVVTSARSMLTRINFPREALLLSGLMQVGFRFLVRLALLVGVLAWFAILPPTTALLFPLGVFSLILFGFTLGLLATPLGLLYGDIQQSLPIATTFLMLLTPVVYKVPTSGVAAHVAALNPLTPLIVTTRDWLTIGPSLFTSSFLIVSAVAAVSFLFAWIAYRVAQPHLIARLGN